LGKSVLQPGVEESAFVRRSAIDDDAIGSLWRVPEKNGGDGFEKESEMKREDVAKTPHYTQPSKVMTVRDLSSYLHVHPGTIYRLLKSNQIPAFRIGSDWRFSIEAIDRWCLQQVRLQTRVSR
jgi:excisionase family DNA binding protein